MIERCRLYQANCNTALQRYEAPTMSIDDGEHTGIFMDFPPEAATLWCWLFRQEGSDRLSHNAGHADFHDVIRNVILTLGVLTRSNKRLRERSFTVYCGDPDFLYVGIPEKSPDSLIAFIHERLSRVAGYECSETAWTPDTLMTPMFRYEKGTIISYRDPELAGQTVIDGPDNFGTGASVMYRDIGPSWMSDVMANLNIECE